MKKLALSCMVLVILTSLLALTSLSKATLIQDCTTCGCPTGQYCDSVTKVCQVGCSANVFSNTCFPNQKPQYCNAQGQTVNNCITCGCPANSDCMADGSCKITPVLTPRVNSEYPYGQKIEITVTTSGITFGSDVQGRIYPEGGNPIPQSSYKWLLDSSNVLFTFNAISNPGKYSFMAYYTRDPYPTVWSSTFPFNVKAPLQVSFLVSDPNQYTVKDIELSLTIISPTGETAQASKTLTGTINGMPLALHESYIDQGSGAWKVIIPKTDLRSGVLDLTMTVTDPQGRYENVVKVVRNILVTAPSVSVSVLAPKTASCNDFKTISIGTNDVNLKPMDVDSLTLTISYPDGITTKEVILNQFRKKSVGVYETDFTFLQGGSYSYHVVAMKDLYASGANPSDRITVVESCGGQTTCDTTSNCDPNCPDDPDCQVKTGIPWWIWMAGIGLVVMIIGGVMLTRRKR